MGKRIVSVVVVLALCLIAGSSTAFANEGASGEAALEDRFWLTLGAFGTARSSEHGTLLPATVGMSWQPTPHVLYTTRYVFVDEMCFFGHRCEMLRDMALMAGVATDSDIAHLSLSAGPALVFVRDIEEKVDPGSIGGVRQTSRVFYTGGLALEAQVFFTPVPAFSLGVSAPIDLNFKKPFAAAIISVRLGKLR